jgi:hypothetical protein
VGHEAELMASIIIKNPIDQTFTKQPGQMGQRFAKPHKLVHGMPHFGELDLHQCHGSCALALA